jgi:HK97 family phage prohead protease
MEEKEIRTWRLDEIEVREADGDGPLIVGYAAVFNQLSENLGGFRERIAPGAFRESLAAGDDVRALWEHDPQYVLGRNVAGTLTLAEDRQGLRVAIRPPATTWAADLMTSMRRGDVNQMSFGFSVPKGGDSWEMVDGTQIRTLKRVRLADVSVVAYPAYPTSSAEARARAMVSERPGVDGVDAVNAVAAVDGDSVADEETQARLRQRQRQIKLIEVK